ncbi:MAG TPA: enoyl-CoA hydratase-related protein, partial [Dehalococcoidia bacterium]|nr:enoyl-CoA hydratase-related protein [Dehalococcoidia bacterium]
TPPPERFPPYAFLSVLVTSAKPTIAAINGVALGGGLALALLCDIRIASERARLAALWIRRGANADFACTYLLPHIIGPPRALEMMYTGDVIGAQEALELGLVNRVVPHEELMPTALALAEKLAKGPPLALGYTKRLAYQATAPRLLGHMTLEGELEQLCLASEDYQEGVRSFLEKRTPVFRGR